MNRKLIRYYTIFMALVLITLIISMYIMKRAESRQAKEGKTKEDIEEVKEYEKKNIVKKDIKVMMTKKNEVVVMDIDDYLKGVVPSEMPPSYDMEALKAQAVVARTYAYEKMQAGSHKDFDICDDFSCCQAFYPKEKILEIWAGRGFDEKLRQEYWSRVEEAVNSTNNIAITYKGQYIKAYFHANSGGKTEDVSQIWGKKSIPYLVSVESLGEENHNYYKSEVIISVSELEQAMNKRSEVACNIGMYNSEPVKIVDYTLSGRVNKVKIGNNIFDATELRTALSLKSTNFTVNKDGDNVKFNVTGYGHGVGMSQTGANYYSKQGWTFDKIVQHYYKDVDITRAE